MTSFRLSIAPVRNGRNERNGKVMATTNTSPTMEAAHKREPGKPTRTKIPTPGLARVHAPAPREGRIAPGGLVCRTNKVCTQDRWNQLETNSSLDMIPGGWLP